MTPCSWVQIFCYDASPLSCSAQTLEVLHGIAMHRPQIQVRLAAAAKVKSSTSCKFIKHFWPHAQAVASTRDIS